MTCSETVTTVRVQVTDLEGTPVAVVLEDVHQCKDDDDGHEVHHARGLGWL